MQSDLRTNKLGNVKVQETGHTENDCFSALRVIKAEQKLKPHFTNFDL